MTEATYEKVQFSTKFGHSNEAMLVLRGETTEDVETLAKTADLQPYLDLIATLGAAVNLTPVPTAGAAPAASAGSASTPPDETDYSKNKERCKHGARKRVDRSPKWIAHFCSLKQGHPDQCAPVFE